MRAIHLGDILQAAGSSFAGGGQFRGWGMYADEADLGVVLQHLWSAREPTVIANLLKVFSNREIPRFDARIIEYCRHDDPEVRRWAFNAMEMNSHHLLREFTLAELEQGVRDRFAISLFIRNYEHGDERRILEAIELPDDVDEFHWLLMSVIEVLESNEEADCSQLGVIAYRETPCGNCRADAVRLLLRQGSPPGWMTEECRYDSTEECRGLVEATTESQQAESE